MPLIDGDVAFGLRRQRWLLHPQPLGSHRETLGQYARLVRPGDTVYDVGANIGLYSRLALSLIGAGRVEAFEPMADNLKLLRRNAALAGDGLLNVHALALGDADAEAVELQVDDVADGTAVLDEVTGGQASEARRAKGLGPKTETVRLAKLDTLRPDLPKPNVIKIDTEGAEAMMLRGAAGVLADDQPHLILATHGDAVAAECFTLLTGHGYHVAGWHRDGWRLLTADDAPELADNNVIASIDRDLVTNEPPLHDLSPRS